MHTENNPYRFSLTAAVFGLLDPIPFGFFVAGLIFDIIYSNTAVILWVKGAAWLITIGLLFAIVPQLINLGRVWFSKRRVRTGPVTLNFWLNVIGIVAAIVNAFVHSRDAYGIMPAGLWLSIATVLALAIGRIVLAGEQVTFKEFRHEQA